MSMPTLALRLSPRATPEWKRVQPLFKETGSGAQAVRSLRWALLYLARTTQPCAFAQAPSPTERWHSTSQEPRIRLPRSPPLGAIQLTSHPTPLAPPTGGRTVKRGIHVVFSGCTRPSPMGKGLATRRSLMGPATGPGSRGRPRWLASGKRIMWSNYFLRHEGLVSCFVWSLI